MVVDVNGISLHWETSGDGEPLLWLHGGMGCGADWRYIFPSAPEGFQVIAPDQRGHGASTTADEEFTFRQSALDIIALLRHLNITRTRAIGLSGGGITLLHMATLQPELIDSMILVSAPPYFPEQARHIQRQFSMTMIDPAELARLRGVPCARRRAAGTARDDGPAIRSQLRGCEFHAAVVGLDRRRHADRLWRSGSPLPRLACRRDAAGDPTVLPLGRAQWRARSSVP